MNDPIREKETKKIKELSQEEMWNELKNQLIATIDENENSSENFTEIIGLPVGYEKQGIKKAEIFMDAVVEHNTKSKSISTAADMADSLAEFIVLLYRFGVASGVAQARTELQAQVMRDLIKGFGGKE